MASRALNPEREAACRAIRQIDAGMTAQEALSKLPESMAHSQTRACADLVYGFLRCRIRLTRILSQTLKSFDKLPCLMKILLGLAAYSLFFQERSAGHAVVNQTVEKIKRVFGAKMGAVANGALRSAQRLHTDAASLEQPAYSDDESGWRSLGIFYSMPWEIVCLWRDSYGPDAALALLKRSFARPWTGVRVNPGSPLAKEVKAALLSLPKAQAVAENGIAIPPGALASEAISAKMRFWSANGAFSCQAAGSMMVMEKLGLNKWIGPVWDCCAGVGGKSRFLLENGVDVGLVSDVSLKRLRHLVKNYSGSVFLGDAARPPVKTWRGDILADVPCSGLGVLARRPDLKKEGTDWSHKFKKMAERQSAILEGLYPALEKGRELAYVTCALNPEENENIAAEFLRKHSSLKLVRQWQTPHDHPWLEGMFGAVFKKI